MKSLITISFLLFSIFSAKMAKTQNACFNLGATEYYVEDQYEGFFSSSDPKEDSVFWDIFKITNPKDGYYVRKWDSLLVMMEGNIVNGKREGVWKFNKRARLTYDMISYQVHYQNGIKNGDYAEYGINNDDTVNLIKGQYQNDKRNGRFEETDYLGSRTTTSESNYLNGFLDGPQIEKNINGEIIKLENYKQGLLFGEQFEYDFLRHQPFTKYLDKKAFYTNTNGTYWTMDLVPSGDTIEFLNFVDSMKVGKQISWDDGDYSGLSHCFYINDTLNGFYYIIQDKDTIQRSYFVNGLKEGYSLTLQKGDTVDYSYFKKGMLDGKSISKYNNKKTTIRETTNYKEGKKEGEYSRYITKKSLFGFRKCLVEVSEYKNDSLDGRSIAYFFKTGKPYYEIIFRKGLPYNVISEFSDKGVKLDAGTLKDGNGVFNFYYPDGELKYSFSFVNGNCRGKYYIYQKYLKAKEEGEFYSTGYKHTSNYESFGEIFNNIYSPVRGKSRLSYLDPPKNEYFGIYQTMESIYDTIHNLTEIKYYKANNKVFENYYLNDNNLKTGIYKSYHDNGKIEEIGNYKIVNHFFRFDSEKDSIWNTYYPSGVLKASENYNQGRLMGVSKYFDELGVLKREYHILNDSNSFSIFNGDTINRTVNNKRCGNWIALASSDNGTCNDNPNAYEYYDNGKPTGTWIYYSKDNKLDKKYYWKDSTIAYFIDYSYKTGKPLKEGYLLNKEVKFGKWKFYDYKKGYLKMEADMDNGECIVYRKNGKVKKIIKDKNIQSYTPNIYRRNIKRGFTLTMLYVAYYVCFKIILLFDKH